MSDQAEPGGPAPDVAQRLTPPAPRQPRQLHTELQPWSHRLLSAWRGLAVLTPLISDLSMKSHTQVLILNL